jgi:hypothetical protein
VAAFLASVVFLASVEAQVAQVPHPHPEDWKA